MPSSSPLPIPDAPVLIIGAGPAGLTAGYLLAETGCPTIILEADEQVGGISRTVVRDGWRFDIGGHRFFTKVPQVEAFWHTILGPDDFLLRPRMSRIYYKGRYYDYPLKIQNALYNLGLYESFLCGLSYLYARIHPPTDQTTLEGWVASRFGYRLYRTFFKTYTEKVWGVPANTIQADWAAQRIKNLDLRKAITNAILPRHKQTEITSLIEEFAYPRHGPGMMWERCADLAQDSGAQIYLNTAAQQINLSDDKIISVQTNHPGHADPIIPVSHVISTMPMAQLVHILNPAPPAEVLQAADNLAYRDFLTIALIVPEEDGFPDNWIYIHAPDVHVGRIQNFGSWSPYMVKKGKTCLGMEYFVYEDDQLWSMPDEDLIALATGELSLLGLVPRDHVEDGYVVRVPKAYPYYDMNYRENVGIIREWLAEHAPNLHLVGRNGMHKYNNQDHSMYTAMLTVDNILSGANHDVWQVNVEDDYHETSTTGRDAPILPSRSPIP